MIECFKGFYINPVGLIVFDDLSLHKETADLVTFTEEILNVKLYFLCSVRL